MSHPPPEFPELNLRWDTVGGHRIFSRLCADGQNRRPPVVLVHGLSMSSRYMVPAARRLALDGPVYAPDLPGYGQSPRPPRTLTVTELAAVLREWMDHLGIGPAVMLGNSMGCQIIAALGAAAPASIHRAVLIGPTMDPSAIHLPKLLWRGALNMLHEPLHFYPVLARDYTAAGVRETFQALENAIRDPVLDHLAQLTAPTLVLRGEFDHLVTQRWAEKVTRCLPQGQLFVIPGAAHVANFDAPDAVAQAVRRLMD